MNRKNIIKEHIRHYSAWKNIETKQKKYIFSPFQIGDFI